MVGTIFFMLLLFLGVALILFFLFFVFLPSLNAQKSRTEDYFISVDEFTVAPKKAENNVDNKLLVESGKLIFCKDGTAKLVFPEQQEYNNVGSSLSNDTLETVKLYRSNIPFLFNFWQKCYKMLHRKTQKTKS